ncbi:MAG: ATP-dependent endonuclease, partial [Pirellulales bacterium]
FRCFGPDPETLTLDDLTVLVGANACGKTSALCALLRLFGTSASERTLVRSDFHLAADENWDDRDSATLSIEATLEFPELADEGDNDDSVAACFKHMTVREDDETPYCRVRLTGEWKRSNLPEGEIEQKLVWVTSPEGTKPKDEKTQGVQGHERSRIHCHYVPAARDPARQIRHVSGSLLHTLLRAVNWSNDSKTAIADASNTIRDTFRDEEGVKQIQKAIEESWNELYGAREHRCVSIRPVGKRLEDLIRQVEAAFSPGPTDNEDGIERLSDGQRSLFYLSIVAALFDVQEKVGESNEEDEPISRDQLNPPLLNILAVEEPENHIAPHFLGRIMGVLRQISNADRGQSIITSHSPSILARALPEEVRHLRTVTPERTTTIRQIELPDEESEQYKFIREAVRAYPELYFAKFVILGEGDSEEIVLPRIAEALSVPIDASFVSVVPLGGRHVNHLWKLLNQLDIPHVTLLDLDRERHGGGWGRIKYAVTQLLKTDCDKKKLLEVDGEKGKKAQLSGEDLSQMHDWEVTDVQGMNAWINCLEEFGVYFSAPLDLDFLMLQAFPVVYQAVAENGDGPDIPDDPDKYEEAVGGAVKGVLKESGTDGDTYNDAEKRAFFWYRYLFLGRGKPTTHLIALSKMKRKDLRTGAPSVLKRLVEKMKASLKEEEDEEDGE